MFNKHSLLAHKESVAQDGHPGDLPGGLARLSRTWDSLLILCPISHSFVVMLMPIVIPGLGIASGNN